jgi:tetratricopeptide (TPR) repeat protein
LAEAYLQTGAKDAKAIRVLEQTRKVKSNDSRYTLALAEAYAEVQSDTPEALETYQIALGTMQAGRGKIAYHAANALRRRNEMDQAIKYYKLALKEGNAPPEVTLKLAEAFVDTGQFSDKSLPVLEAAVKMAPDDLRLLEGYCRCLIAARVSDANAASVAAQLLGRKAESQAGLFLMAKCALQAGKGSEAAASAEKAFAANKKDSDMLLLLAQAYVAAARKDAHAIEILKAAASISSGDEQAEFGKALALAYVDGNANSDEAYAAVKQAAELHPQDERLQLGVVHAAQDKNDTQALIAALERLAAIGRSTPDMAARLASAYAQNRAITLDAEKSYREALKVDPSNRDVLRAMARIILANERMDADAVLLLEKLLQVEPVSPALGTYLARAYMRNSRFEEATKLTQILLKHSPESEELKKLVAQASLQTNRIDDAIRQYEQLYQSHSDDNDALLNLADAYAQKQRVDDEAAAIYDKALNVDPKRAAIRVALGRHHSISGRFARGLEEYRQALSIDASLASQVRDDLKTHIATASDRTDLRWMLTDLLIDTGQLPQAVAQLDEIFEQDPALLRQVLQGLDRILTKDPSSLVANLRKGVLLKAQGRFEEARPLLEHAHEINPAHAEAATELRDLYQTLLQENDDVKLRFDLGRAHYSLQDYDAAIGQFQKTAQDFRFENDSIKMLGLCFVGKGMLEFALQEFKKLVIDEEMKEILYDLAQRYEAKNDVVGAKQVYRELYRADINYKNVKQKFDMLAGNTSDPLALERSSLMTQLSEKARRRYELVEELGRGAMGIVYKARDNELDEFVALKILPDNLSQNPEAVARFRSEARSARRLAHPNIVRIHDIGEEMGRKYISMEYVAGGDLKNHFRVTRGGKMAPQEIAAIMIPITNAMDYAHSLQIVHRDIKPANIMLDEQHNPKVSDFGIAKMLEKTSETIAGAIIGTPLYMSPEQVQGLNVDHRADIYALGIMMYEFANGRPPFTEGDLAYQHIHVMPKAIEGVPDILNEIILKCLEKVRDKRWARSADIQKALENSGLL